MKKRDHNLIIFSVCYCYCCLADGGGVVKSESNKIYYQFERTTRRTFEWKNRTAMSKKQR